MKFFCVTYNNSFEVFVTVQIVVNIEILNLRNKLTLKLILLFILLYKPLIEITFDQTKSDNTNWIITIIKDFIL